MAGGLAWIIKDYPSNREVSGCYEENFNHREHREHREKKSRIIII